MDARLFKGSFGLGGVTQTANTAISLVVPPTSRAYTRITKIQYLSGSTVHSVQVLKCQHATTTTAAAAASQADIVLADVTTINEADGGTTTETLAGSDYVVVKHTDGTYGVYIVSSVSSLTVTLTTNLSKAVDSGAPVYKMYELARPATGKGFPAQVFKPAASTLTSLGSESADMAVAESPNKSEPLVVHSDNATAAGFLHLVQGVYSTV